MQKNYLKIFDFKGGKYTNVFSSINFYILFFIHVFILVLYI